MNTFLLLIILMTILLLNFYANGKNLLAPGVIASSVFTLSVALVLVDYPYWKYDVSILTVVLISAAVAFFSVGCLFGKQVKIREYFSGKLELFIDDRYAYDLSVNVMAIFSLICIGVTAYYFIYQYRLSLSLGNISGILGIVGTIRLNVISHPEVYHLGMTLNIGISLLRAIGHLSLFNLCAVLLCKDRHKAKKYVIPVVCLLIYGILTTGRAPFIGYAVSVIMNVYIIQKKRGVSINEKMIHIVLRSFIAFMILFWGMGFMTGKGGLTFWDTFSIYLGSSVVCLDNVISKPMIHSGLWGENIFVGVYNILRKIGFLIPAHAMHGDFVYWGEKYSSNVYTSLCPYIRDFGMLVAILGQLIVGTIFGIAWKKFESNKGEPIFIVIYGRFFGISLVMYSIAEEFFSSVLSMNVLVEIFFYFCLWYMYKRKYYFIEDESSKRNMVYVSKGRG